jgi:hypothetical protein
MQKNKVLSYVSAVHSVFEDLTSDADNILYESDDGNSTTVQQGKDAAIELLNEAVRQIQELRVDIENKSYNSFCLKRGICA